MLIDGITLVEGSDISNLTVDTLDTTARDALPSPDLGEVIWNTTVSKFQVYNGASWDDMGTSGEISSHTTDMTVHITTAQNTLLDGISVNFSDVNDVVNKAKLDTVQDWSAQQTFTAASLTDGANISWDLSSQQVADVTLAGNRTLDNPTNMKNGGTYILTIIQDGTGGRTLSFGSAYKFKTGTAPTISTGINAVDILTFVSDGSNMFGVAQQDMS